MDDELLIEKTTKARVNRQRTRRKAVRVRGVKPLHYRHRTAEQFEIGDAAWISFNGKIAYPVRVVGKDDRHYDVKAERPSRRVSTHSLFLDEVRSTPEAACINMVTL